MTKKEIYETLIRGDGDKIERQCEPNNWRKLWDECDVLYELLTDLKFDEFDPDNYRMRKDNS